MKNNKKINCLLVSLLLSFSSASQGALFGPSNYNECIIDAMKGVTSDVAARAIKQSCRDKHNNNPTSKDITKYVRPKMEDLKGGFSESMNGYNFYVQFYNASNHVVTSMILTMSFKNAEGQVFNRKYRSLTYSQPMNTEDHFFSVNLKFKPTIISWDIETINGYKN